MNNPKLKFVVHVESDFDKALNRPLRLSKEGICTIPIFYSENGTPQLKCTIFGKNSSTFIDEINFMIYEILN